MNNGGDVLASGRSGTAQFAGASSGITQFENDVIYLDVPAVLNKYGLTQEEYDQYTALRLDGQKLPDLTPVDLQEKLGVGFEVTDHRHNYMGTDAVSPEAKKLTAKKFPDAVYAPVATLMDRLMVMVISDDPNIVLLEDGSAKNLKTGLIETAKYRQHSNVGIVLLAGQWVVLSGLKTPMQEILRAGDKVVYGDYGSEKFPLKEEKAINLCESLGVNYEKTEQGMRIIRVQDVRTVERRIATEEFYRVEIVEAKAEVFNG
jgi:co-chaperonin GroES (HSP10)